MKYYFTMLLSIFLWTTSYSQSIKDGIIYDTLTTIENEDFLVSQAFFAYRDEGYGTHGGTICFCLVAKRDMSVLFSKEWFNCKEYDILKGDEEWGGATYSEFKKGQEFHNVQIGAEYEIVDGKFRIKLNCEEDPSKHIVRGYVWEYFIGRYRKYLVIDKFKIVSKFKIYEYLPYRDYMLKNKTK